MPEIGETCVLLLPPRLQLDSLILKFVGLIVQFQFLAQVAVHFTAIVWVEIFD